MDRKWLWAIAGASVLLPSLARAEDIKSAAAEYDAGRRAYTENKFEEAAIHFENAYHDAPNSQGSAQTLRNAMRARRQAGQLARAATLAALAQTKFGTDDATANAAREIFADANPKLHRVTITCEPACGVTADGRVVSLEDSARFLLYFDPGPHTLAASWSDNRTKEIKVDGKPGTREELNLDAPPVPVKPDTTTPTPGTGTPTPTVPDHVTPPPATKPLGPALFVVGVVLTAAAGGVLIWSGVDTLNNPGVDAVKKNCVGQNESCPDYQKGLSSQLRTNVMIGVTSGLAAVTIVVAIFTQFSSPKKKDAAPQAVQIFPSLGISPSGGTAGLQGAF